MENAAIRRDPHTGRYVATHGSKGKRLYGVWCAMKERCCNPNSKSYQHYGAKGISVCNEWLSDYSAFEAWAIDAGYDGKLTIDRIDNDKGYSPDNCRWATYGEQNRNYSKNNMITYKGETMCLADMADKHGIGRSTVMWRLRNGKTIKEAFSKYDGRSIRYGKSKLLSRVELD